MAIYSQCDVASTSPASGTAGLQTSPSNTYGLPAVKVKSQNLYAGEGKSGKDPSIQRGACPSGLQAGRLRLALRYSQTQRLCPKSNVPC